jgi:hypothetical protein
MLDRGQKCVTNIFFVLENVVNLMRSVTFLMKKQDILNLVMVISEMMLLGFCLHTQWVSMTE